MTTTTRRVGGVRGTTVSIDANEGDDDDDDEHKELRHRYNKNYRLMMMIAAVLIFAAGFAAGKQQQAPPQVQDDMPPSITQEERRTTTAASSSTREDDTSSDCAMAVLPRARKQGHGCEPALECAWSLDSIRTQVVSRKLYERATGKTLAYQWQEDHYDELNKLYEMSDKDLLKRTGVVKLNLPESIHQIPTGGEPYFRRALRDADMVVDGLIRAGARSLTGQWLDFGGSHGRVTNVIAAAFNDVPSSKQKRQQQAIKRRLWLHVCDPIVETVDWAQKQFVETTPRKVAAPGTVPHQTTKIHFAAMQQKPPLKMYRDAQFDVVYAISIWSHYSEEAALLWFAEVHRILKPGGHLWFSTHGWQAINFASLEGASIHLHRETMMQALYQKGHYYFPMFGTSGDWGVDDGKQGSWWGYGAFTAEWLAAKVLNDPTNSWKLSYFGPGVNERHQDVYVITKTRSSGQHQGMDEDEQDY